MRLMPWVCLVGCLTAFPGAAAAQETITSRVDRVFAAYDRKDSPGCALGVYQDGKIVYARGYGMADLDTATPITAETVFDIGSTSKQFTAASILLLAQRGALSLDDDVRRYIPELPSYQKPITIRHLLHHTSGLRDYIGLLTLGGASTSGHTTARQALDAIVRQKALNFEPGAEFLYSNSGYFLLSQIVERVSGKTLRAFAEENIFGPLGMRSTHFRDDHKASIANRAIGYAPAGPNFRTAMSDWEQTGDGAVQTTVEDLLHWDNNFYEPRVGGKALLTELVTQGTLSNASPISYARGLMIESFRGLEAVSHGGSWAGYRAELIRFPDQRFSVAALCNVASANPSALARAVAAIYLEASLGPVAQPAPPADAAKPAAAPVSVPPSDLQGWVATYRNEVTGTIRAVTLEGAKLMASFGQVKQELVPRSASEFTATLPNTSLRLVFERAGDGTRRMRQFVDGREVALFVELVPPSADVAKLYEGAYYSEELNTTFTLVAADGSLEIRREGASTIPLRALSNTLFSSPGELTLRFKPGADGRATSFEASLGRARGLTFVRTGG